MAMTTDRNPFHAGEIEAQKRAGVTNVASWAAGFIRQRLPKQHRDFHTSLPFLVVSAADEAGRPWVTILEGPDGFVRSPDPRTLTVSGALDPQDPLTQTLDSGADIGLLGIDLATRRRNRLSGFFHPTEDGFAIDVRQAFGNCPQYIHEREWRRVEKAAPVSASISDHLARDQVARIKAADTLFIGTGQRADEDHESNGYDA